MSVNEALLHAATEMSREFDREDEHGPVHNGAVYAIELLRAAVAEITRQTITYEVRDGQHRIHVTTPSNCFTIMVNDEGLAVDVESNNDEVNDVTEIVNVVWADWEGAS